jgi:hypothetical protein
VNGLQVIGQEGAVCYGSLATTRIWGIGMYWAFYDPQANRDINWSGHIAVEGDVPRKGKRSAPKTSEQLLFLLEDVDAVDKRRPNTVVH